MIWFIADPHFGHANIIKYAKRPFEDLVRMNAHLVARWQKTVKPTDIIYVLGDFAFGSRAYAEWLVDHLHGIKILIHGNHDRGHRAMESLGFACCLSSAVVNLDGKDIMLSHRPIYGPLPDNVSGIFHGHTHRANPADLYEAGECAYIPPWNVNLCVELWEYTPVPYKCALKELRKNMSSGKDV